MLLRPSTDICPKELARDMRGFFNSLLGDSDLFAEVNVLDCVARSLITSSIGRWNALRSEIRPHSARSLVDDRRKRRRPANHARARSARI